MIKTTLDFLQFMFTNVPLLTSLTIFTLLSILLAKSIKEHARVYYLILVIPFLLMGVSIIARWFGAETFLSVPILGQFLRDFTPMSALGQQLFIIVMYMGALGGRNPYVKRLMSIRKKLAIIAGFAVLTHVLNRAAVSFIPALRYFTDNEAFMANNPHVVSELGAFISSFSLVLGVVMFVVFLPLWISSFNSVRLRMNAVKWKKLHRLAYVLYATLFIHAAGITTGRILNPPVQAQRPAIEVSVQTTSKGFADFEMSPKNRQYVHLTTLVLIYGSYVFLRVRKANRNKKNKEKMRRTAV